MPIRKSDYAPDWPVISAQVREEAAWCCEWCMAPNGDVIRRLKPDYPHNWETVGIVGEEPTKTMSWARLRFHGLTRIVLTVAHLDRNSQNNDRSNLAALCQRCHLRHDIRQHIANRRYGRHHAKAPQTKLEL